MSNYWLVNFFFNMAFFFMTACLFLLFGSKVFRFTLFTDTSLTLFIMILIGWGYAQISVAFLLSVFVNKSQTATIVGYTFAVWFSTVAGIFNITIYSKPNVLDWFLYPIPTFTFSRLMYHIARSCGYESCISSFSDMNSEMVMCFIFMYAMATVYLLLALYLYEVVPSTFGVPKKWNYLCVRNRGKTLSRDTDEIGDLENERE